MDDFGHIELPVRDADYERWVREHQHGHVINAHKTGAFPTYWHRADCGHIRPDGETRFVEGDFIKACSLNPGALAVWAKARPEALNYCMSCRDTWLREQGA
jgi:hypothetical protein